MAQTSTRKQLQRFLGFANLYRRFIRDYSRVAGPLNQLTSPAIPFSWTTQAEAAFSELKRRFTSAPILTNPDPSLQFIVEVDPTPGWGLFYHNAQSPTKSFTLVLFFPTTDNP